MEKNDESKKVSKTVIRKIPDENAYFTNPFAETLDCDESIVNNIVICGNRDFSECGDDTLIAVVKGDYYDDDDKPGTDEPIGYDYDKFEELKKLTGKDWEETTFRGYGQSDWQTVYYVPAAVSEDRMERLEAFYMGKYGEYEVFEDVDPDDFENEDRDITAIPHDVCWKGKKGICEYCGVNPDDTVVLEDDGYTKVYNYKEVE